MKKYFLISVMGLLFILMPPMKVFADKVTETIDGGDSTVYYIRSDGQNTSNHSQSGDTETSHSYQSSRQLTKAEQNAVSLKNNIRKCLSDWKQNVQNSPDYVQKFYLTSYDAVSIAFAKISANEVKALAENVKKMKEQSIGEAEWVNRNYMPSVGETDPDSDLKDMSGQEKREIKKEIIKKEQPQAITQYAYDRVFTAIPQNNPEFVLHVTPLHLIVHNNEEHQYIQNGEIVREDIYSGCPSLRDTTTYTDRFNPILSEVEDNHWYDSSSVYMEDSITVSLLTDYHLYRVKKDYITNITYLSNKRRWTITKDGVSMAEPVITDDPRHELNFTDVYKANGPGVYHVVAEQLADVQRSTFVQYDICEYLFETNTGAILWYNEKSVRGREGGSIYLNTVTNQEWVETGDTFDLTINDLSDIEQEGSATQREE